MLHLFAEVVPDAPSNLRIFVAIVGILIIIFTLFRMNRRRRARIAASGEASPMPSPSPRAEREDPSPAVAGKAMARDLQEVMVQMQEITREVEGRLDTRVRFAQRLLQQSEEAADRLERLLDRARDMEASDRLEIPSVTSAVKEDQALDVVSAPEPETPDRAEVLRLSAEGKSAPEIAGETGLPIGEVELIVNLGKAKKKTS